MASPVYLSLSHLRLPRLSSRRLRPILASSTPRFRSKFKPRKFYERDMVIDIGRYKGRMLGTLPPSYLKWLAESGDLYPEVGFWSEPAKVVLEDPVYRDRIEWEPAQRLFSGDGVGSFLYDESFGPSKAYNEIGETFGWDMEDKHGWSLVNRDFLGTSYSGRIPRKKDKRGKLGVSESVERGESENRGGVFVGGKRGERIEKMRLKREKVPMPVEEQGEVKERGELGNLDNGNGVNNGKKVGFLVGKKRGVRIERMRLRRENNVQMVKSEKEVVEEEISEEKKEEVPKTGVTEERASRRKTDLGRNQELDVGINGEMMSFSKREQKSGEDAEILNPFPGRDAVLRRLGVEKTS